MLPVFTTLLGEIIRGNKLEQCWGKMLGNNNNKLRESLDELVRLIKRFVDAYLEKHGLS